MNMHNFAIGDQWYHAVKFKHLLKCSVKRDGIIYK